MIDVLAGDIFGARAEAYVNPVNCVGVMGKGLALHFKREFPRNFLAYEDVCRRGLLMPGLVLTVPTLLKRPPQYVINLPTKRHWRDASRMDDIAAGLDALVAEIGALAIRSVAVPALGCGQGGLAWSEVRPLIERKLAPLAGMHVLLFEP